MWLKFHLLCVLLSSSVGQHSSLNYLLIIPAQIDYPSTETACLDITGGKEPLNITVTLHHALEDTTILQQELTEPKLFKCVKFKSPRPSGRREEVISIQISIVGKSTQISESKMMLVSNMGSFTQIQTDKPIYKPGQFVQFRILLLNRDFTEVNNPFPLVEIQDPNKNRIGQWADLIPKRGIIDLSFPLDSESELGVYMIITPNAQQEFHVSEYVPPTFEINVLLPAVVTVMTKNFPLKICVRYTFGKAVQGEITAKLCRKSVCHYWLMLKKQCPQDICIEYRRRTDRKGCFEEEVQTELFHLNLYGYFMTLDADAYIIEDGTGIRLNSTSSSKISALIAKVEFEETETSASYYKSGLRYRAKLKLSSADGSLMKSQTLYLTEQYDEVTKEHVFETDEKGEVNFSLDTRPWNGQTVYLVASYQKKKPERVFGILNPYFSDAYRTLNSFNSATNSFVKVQPLNHLLSDKENAIEIDYLIRHSEMITEEDTLDLHYVVVARGNLVVNGEEKIKINKNSVSMGTMEILLPVTADFAPVTEILAYTLLGNGNIAADTEIFHVARSFNNKVSLRFSDEEITPKSQTTLHVKAQPGSLCSVRSVDEAILLLRPESDISTDSVYKLLERRRKFGYPYRVHEDTPICRNLHSVYSYGAFRRKRRYADYPLAPHSSSPDAFTLIQQIGLKVLTSTNVRKPVACSQYPEVAALSLYGAPPLDTYSVKVPVRIAVHESDWPWSSSISASEMHRRVRKNFLETLIWGLFTVGESGQADITVKVPDSITEWKATAFCMGDIGLGIAKTTSVRTFLPFFTSSTLPYSVVREERFAMTASVFNFLSNPMMVNIRLNHPAEIKVENCTSCIATRCLYPEESIVLSWEAQALQVGSADIMVSVEAVHTEEKCRGELPIVPETGAYDAVVKSLVIKAEGVPVEKSHNSILCGGGNLSSETLFITVPPEAVPGSLTAMFSVVGDPMGSALQGTEQLLTLPCGCGEQNMAKFVLNVYVKNYLESTNQMTDELKQLGVQYMRQGYKRQLAFRRKDGSFSAFGESDEEGNAWLTAFVMKSFYAASHCISVDKNYIEETGIWLKKNQLPNGCFRSRGKLFKTSYKGRVTDQISLCAYITIAFLETGWPVEDPTIQNALACLRDSIPLLSSVYTKSLLAYLFTLAKDYKIRGLLLQELHDRAVKTGGKVYWPANPDDARKQSMWSEPDSNEVEKASYVILAHISLESPTKEDIIKASSIAKFVAEQRNPHGSFANTQDSVVGFQALALYYKLTYTKQEALEITLSAQKEGILHQFYVDEKTRLLLQRKQLKTVPGNYTVQVEGEGCAFVQTSLKYNVYNTQAKPAFNIQISVSNITVENKAHINYTISIRYTGPREASNMALVRVELPSGFNAVEESLTMMTNGLIRKTEREDSHVNIYISELSKASETFTFLAKEEFIVYDHKPKMVKVIDYYKTGEEAVKMYDVPIY